ncbi:hypothetical protein CMEL01_16733 [Colletotrichum melonis]|uniref:Uncharacterized protein n=1 Tax=Colletotrichum melonis TaxID=1209925 RepID=A0AAI9UBX4_9PEZI|nr:hypothetical protein CMEL01_16733 [Colletotrichum melonis]
MASKASRDACGRPSSSTTQPDVEVPGSRPARPTDTQAQGTESTAPPTRKYDDFNDDTDDNEDARTPKRPRTTDTSLTPRTIPDKQEVIDISDSGEESVEKREVIVIPDDEDDDDKIAALERPLLTSISRKTEDNDTWLRCCNFFDTNPNHKTNGTPSHTHAIYGVKRGLWPTQLYDVYSVLEGSDGVGANVANGCLLGNEMGTGKTLTYLAVLAVRRLIGLLEWSTKHHEVDHDGTAAGICGTERRFYGIPCLCDETSLTYRIARRFPPGCALLILPKLLQGKILDQSGAYFEKRLPVPSLEGLAAGRTVRFLRLAAHKGKLPKAMWAVKPHADGQVQTATRKLVSKKRKAMTDRLGNMNRAAEQALKARLKADCERETKLGDDTVQHGSPGYDDVVRDAHMWPVRRERDDGAFEDAEAGADVLCMTREAISRVETFFYRHYHEVTARIAGLTAKVFTIKVVLPTFIGTLIWDESHNANSTNSNIAKVLQHVTEGQSTPPFQLYVTGTPAQSRLTQMVLMMKGLSYRPPGRNGEDGNFGSYDVGPQALAELDKRNRDIQKIHEGPAAGSRDEQTLQMERARDEKALRKDAFDLLQGYILNRRAGSFFFDSPVVAPIARDDQRMECKTAPHLRGAMDDLVASTKTAMEREQQDKAERAMRPINLSSNSHMMKLDFASHFPGMALAWQRERAGAAGAASIDIAWSSVSGSGGIDSDWTDAERDTEDRKPRRFLEIAEEGAFEAYLEAFLRDSDRGDHLIRIVKKAAADRDQFPYDPRESWSLYDGPKNVLVLCRRPTVAWATKLFLERHAPANVTSGLYHSTLSQASRGELRDWFRSFKIGETWVGGREEENRSKPRKTDTRVLVSTYQLLGEAIDDLKAANYLVHMSLPYCAGQEDQGSARVCRAGQRLPVHVYHLSSPAEVADQLARRMRYLNDQVSGNGCCLDEKEVSRIMGGPRAVAHGSRQPVPEV